MYEAFFQFRTRPFPATPRTDLYFPASASEASRLTLARCIERAEGPGLLIGGPGTGKSLVCGLLADQFRERFHLVKLDQARFCTRRALLQTLLFELQLPYRGLDEGELRLALIEFAKTRDSHREGVLLMIDEAQTLPARLVEEVRMIGNVIVGGQPRLRLILSGSAALEERLTSPKLESFNQRIAARCYLQPLSYDETAGYLHAQFNAAGAEANRLLADNAWQAVYHASGGIPRLINQVCDRALVLAHAAQRRSLDAALIEEAWADLQQLPLPWPSKAGGAATEISTVVEFGTLAAEPVESHAVPPQLTPVGPLAADSADAFEPAEALAETVPDSREVIDLTSQLEQIELHVAEWEATERPARSAPVPAPASPADTRGARMAAVGPDADPFDDGFVEEQAVVDHYASLEAQARRHGRVRPSPQEHEFAAAVQTIFEPLASAGPAAASPATPGGDAPAARETSPVAAPSGAASCEPEPAPVTLKVELPEDEADDAPATLQVEALRILPPDDSDLIVVLDAEAHVGQLSRTAGKAHRQEYRQLFTKLRGN